VLVLTGRADPLSRPEANQEMAEAIPGSHLAILEECGHMAPQEQPAEVNRCLAHWLDTQ
jgi:pimeloyl-ACP methyl ester carboxylesterase